MHGKFILNSKEYYYWKELPQERKFSSKYKLTLDYLLKLHS